MWRQAGPNERLRRGRGRGGGGAQARSGAQLGLVMEASAARLLLLPLLLLGAWAPAPGGASPEAPPLVNEDVKRTVDLSSHLAKVTAEVVLAHPGGGSAPRATSFLLALEPELEARLAHLGVQVSAGRPLPPGAPVLRARAAPSQPPRGRGARGAVGGPRRPGSAGGGSSGPRQHPPAATGPPLAGPLGEPLRPAGPTPRRGQPANEGRACARASRGAGGLHAVPSFPTA